MLRCAASYDTVDELKDAFDRLASAPSVHILQVKNRFHPDYKDPGGLGYRDVNVLVRIDGISHGYVVEVQLHLKTILAVKSEEGHRAYVTMRDSVGG